MRAGFLLLLAGLICASGAQTGNQSTSQTSSSQIGYKSAENAEQKKTLLLKDFHPVSMLHAPVHEIERAKFYVFDVHNHLTTAPASHGLTPPPRSLASME